MVGGTHVCQIYKLDQPGRVAEWRRLLNGSSELMVRGDYHLPFGRDEARSEAALWLWPATAL